MGAIGDGAARAAVFAASGRHQRVHAGGQAGVEIPGAKRRDQLVFDDLLAQGVGQGAFEPVAGHDADVVTLLKQEKHGAIFPLLLANPPLLGDAHGVVLDRGVGLHPRIDRDHQLVGGVAHELREFGVELLRGVAAHHTGVVVEVIRGYGRNHLGGVGAGREKAEQQAKQAEGGDG